MSKVAIFVEGQTELIFVRELLLNVFNYQVSLSCFNLVAAGNFKPTEYAFSMPDALHTFQIINVGNDNAVLSRILSREKDIWSQGFDTILGLRDMYSENYLEAAGRNISVELNQKFIEGSNKTIQEKAQRPERIFLSFAIMEVEAWILAITSWFENAGFDLELIEKELHINLFEVDPESTFFRPAGVLERIYELFDRRYQKNKDNINAILGMLGKSDFLALRESGKCASYSHFLNTLPSVNI